MMPIPDNGDRLGEVSISGEHMHGSEVVFAQQIGQRAKTSAQAHHVGGRECDCELSRRRGPAL
jgi:hypothetical protein